MVRRLVIFQAMVAFVLLWPAMLSAQDPAKHNNFFEKNSVRDVFGGQIQMGEAPEAEYFPRRPTPFPEEPEVVPGMYQPNQQGTPGQQPPQTTPAPVQLMTKVRKESGKDPLADEIVSQYGDPTKDAPIPVVTNAPAPFKGLMAALSANRDDLAMMYARQYVRHFKNLETRNKAVLKYTRAGVLAEKKAQNAAEEEPLEEETLSDPQALREREMTEAEKNLQIDAEALALVEQARASREERLARRKAEAFAKHSQINSQGE